MIKYHSGINEVITAFNDTANTVTPAEKSEPKPETEQLSTISLVLSMAGLAVSMFLNMGYGLLISALAFIFAIASIIIIDNSKNMKKGSGSAIAAIVICVFTAAITLLALSTY